MANSELLSAMPSAEPISCVVIGAGVAGFSAVTWLYDLGVDFRWHALAPNLGGMLWNVHNHIANFPGGLYENGRKLVEALEQQRCDLGLDRPICGAIEKLARRDQVWRITRREGAPLVAKTVILATGTRYRTLGIEGEEEGFAAGYISQSATRDCERVAGSHVAVVGGGDAAFENALLLAEKHCRVTMILRSEPHKARREFVLAARKHERIDALPIPAEVRRIKPVDTSAQVASQRRITVDVLVGDKEQHLVISTLFVRIGVEVVMPDIEPLPQIEGRRLVVDPRQSTSLAGLFAAGDLTSRPLRSIATAAGDGAQAARSVFEWCQADAST